MKHTLNPGMFVSESGDVFLSVVDGPGQAPTSAQRVGHLPQDPDLEVGEIRSIGKATRGILDKRGASLGSIILSAPNLAPLRRLRLQDLFSHEFVVNRIIEPTDAAGLLQCYKDAAHPEAFDNRSFRFALVVTMGTHHAEAALYDLSDDVCETLATRRCPLGDGVLRRAQDAMDLVIRLFRSSGEGATNTAGRVVPRDRWESLVVRVADECDSRAAVEGAIRACLDVPGVAPSFYPLELGDIARGAAVHGGILCGAVHGLLPLNATSYKYVIATDRGPLALVDWDVTIPTSRSERFALGWDPPQDEDAPYPCSSLQALELITDSLGSVSIPLTDDLLTSSAGMQGKQRTCEVELSVFVDHKAWLTFRYSDTEGESTRSVEDLLRTALAKGTLGGTPADERLTGATGAGKRGAHDEAHDSGSGSRRTREPFRDGSGTTGGSSSWVSQDQHVDRRVHRAHATTGDEASPLELATLAVLGMTGVGILKNASRLLACLADQLGFESGDLGMLMRNCDDELLRPLAQTAVDPGASSDTLKAAERRMVMLLVQDRSIDTKVAEHDMHALCHAVQTYLHL